MHDPPELTVLPDTPIVTYEDALSASWGPNSAFLVTTPNANFVPEIVEGIVTVCLRDDGTFGEHDPIQWPQIFAWQHPYLAAIPKRPTNTPEASPASCPHSAIWQLPTPDDFIPNGRAPGYGSLRPHFLDLFQPLVAKISTDVRQYTLHPLVTVDISILHRYEIEMAMAWERLYRTPATYRDQVLQLGVVRRYWLLCSGFMTFYDLLGRDRLAGPLPSNGDLIGAWTSEPRAAQMLFAVGIPVWLVRPSTMLPSHIRVATLMGMVSTATLCLVKFHGAEPVYGSRHLQVTFISGELACLSGGQRDPCGYQDLSIVPTATISKPNEHVAFPSKRQYPTTAPFGRSVDRIPRGVGSSSKPRRYRPLPYLGAPQQRNRKVHPSQFRGRDKFLEVSHPWMPAPLASWGHAMRAVDRSDKVRPGRWGYWIPEPGLLVGPKDPIRLQKYLMSWLRARPFWLYILQVPGSLPTSHRTQVWRDFLNGVEEDAKTFTKHGKRVFEIKQLFSQVFSEQEQSLQPDAGGEAEWHGHRVSEIDDRIGPLVLWETFELGFRYELAALDHALRYESPAHELDRLARLARVFPGESMHAVLRLPTPDSRSLGAPLPHHRIPSLKALREILLLWPMCPPEIARSRPLDTTASEQAIQELEVHLASFYTQMFFDVAGRAPLVPHCFPSHLM